MDGARARDWGPRAEGRSREGGRRRGSARLSRWRWPPRLHGVDEGELLLLAVLGALRPGGVELGKLLDLGLRRGGWEEQGRRSRSGSCDGRESCGVGELSRKL